MIALLFSLSLWASDCTFHITQETLNYEGYPIYVGTELRKVMQNKGYSESNPGRIEVETQFTTSQGRFFQWAISDTIMTDFETREVQVQGSGSNRCITQLCSVWDVQKSIQSSIKSFAQKMPTCR